MKTLKLQSAGGLSCCQRRGRVSPAPLSPPPRPSTTRSRWVRMRLDDAPREENETKGQDTATHSWLVDETTPRVRHPRLTRWEGPVPPPSATAEALRESHPLHAACRKHGGGDDPHQVTGSPCTEPLVLCGSRGRGRGAGTWCCSPRS